MQYGMRIILMDYSFDFSPKDTLNQGIDLTSIPKPVYKE